MYHAGPCPVAFPIPCQGTGMSALGTYGYELPHRGESHNYLTLRALSGNPTLSYVPEIEVLQFWTAAVHCTLLTAPRAWLRLMRCIPPASSSLSWPRLSLQNSSCRPPNFGCFFGAHPCPAAMATVTQQSLPVGAERCRCLRALGLPLGTGRRVAGSCLLLCCD